MSEKKWWEDFHLSVANIARKVTECTTAHEAWDIANILVDVAEEIRSQTKNADRLVENAVQETVDLVKECRP